MTRRRPWIAALLSLLLAGLGHLYAGQPRTAVLAFLISVLAALAAGASALLVPLAPINILPGYLAFLLVVLGIPLHAALTARRADADYRLRPYNRWYLYLGIWALLALGLQPAVFDYAQHRVAEAFRIPSGAMQPTLLPGDFLFAAKWRSAVSEAGHGSIVVHESLEEPGLKVVKRVVGLPGDTLQMVGGDLYRNGQRLDEPYVIHVDRERSEDALQRSRMRSWQVQYLAGRVSEEYAPDLQDWGPLVVPPDSFFGLGDNRDESYDSRYYGFLPLGSISGRPWVIYFSYDPDAPGSFLKRIRWTRFGRLLH